MNLQESLPQQDAVVKIENIQEPEKSIESSANFKGNWWLAQLARLENPIIKKQLTDLWEANEKYMADKGTQKHVSTEIRRNKETGAIVWKDEDLGISEYDTVYETIPYNPLTPDEIKQQINDAIEREKTVTAVNFELPASDSSNILNIPTPKTDEPEREYVHHPNKRASEMGVKNVDLQEDEVLHNQNPNYTGIMSMVEAHEKGHSIRTLHRSTFLESKFDQAFDLPKSSMYLDTSEPSELLERMAQLKNYFGMSGAEKFTPKHLEYARAHYVEDVGFDNNMTEFFGAITPEKEFSFLKLINSVGI
jgi:hypothetical protein